MSGKSKSMHHIIIIGIIVLVNEILPNAVHIRTLYIELANDNVIKSYDFN